MRAVRFERPGEPLVDADVQVPELVPGYVLVEVGAAGICHSDAHYRGGRPAPADPPVTLGHETAGTIVEVGEGVAPGRRGERVAVHYVVACGRCHVCRSDREQFCASYDMIGNTVDGGYADYVAVPERNAVPVPAGVPLAQAAIMMCSTVTALHALNRGRMQPGEVVAVFGVGGLGQSAVRLALARGAGRVFAVDLDAGRLSAAAAAGAHRIIAGDEDPVAAIRSDGGADVAIDMAGAGSVMRQAVDSLRRGGRAVAVGIAADPVPVTPYEDLIVGELELIGANDHTRGEVVEVLDLAASGALDLGGVITERVPLTADAVNAVLDRLDAGGPGMRAVIVPGAAVW